MTIFNLKVILVLLILEITGLKSFQTHFLNVYMKENDHKLLFFIKNNVIWVNIEQIMLFYGTSKETFEWRSGNVNVDALFFGTSKLTFPEGQ